MDVQQFWQLIKKTRIKNDWQGQRQAELLIQELVQLSIQDIIDFENIFNNFWGRADRGDIDDVGQFIVSYGDSGWKDFRGWLIGQGQQTYEKVLADPDWLAEIISIENRFEIQAELLLYVGQNAYEIKMGDENAIVPWLDNEIDSPFERGESLWKTFTTWEDYYRRFAEKFPKTWAKFYDEVDNSY